MATLTIRNIGPIRDVSLKLNRYNFFIGQQSSGKSTIAKIISNCLWLEKEIATHPNKHSDLSDYEKGFIAQIEEFHYMEGYFNFKGDSLLEYNSNYIHLLYNEGNCHIELCKNIKSYERNKILYIPAERLIFSKTTNFVGNTNLNSFATDWVNARDYYDNKHKLKLLSLNINYYQQKEQGKVIDRIMSADSSSSYDIKLSNSSSGLQSVVPLASSIDFYSHIMYLKDMENSLLTPEQNKDRIDVTNYLKRNYANLTDIPQSVLNRIDRLTKTKRTCFIIEEPELNIYPDTQRDVLNFIIKNATGYNRRKNFVTITTHSPYIINQLNLLIKAFDKKKKVGGASINYDDLNVYSVQNGCIRDLKVKNAHLIDTTLLSEAINETYDAYESEKFD